MHCLRPPARAAYAAEARFCPHSLPTCAPSHPTPSTYALRLVATSPIFCAHCTTRSAGDKLAVIGRNGSGKSSLLKLLASQAKHDAGTLSMNKGRVVLRVYTRVRDCAHVRLIARARAMQLAQQKGTRSSTRPHAPTRAGATIGYLAQDPALPQGCTVLQAVLQSDSAVARAVQQYQATLRSSARGGEGANKVRGLVPGMLWGGVGMGVGAMRGSVCAAAWV